MMASPLHAELMAGSTSTACKMCQYIARLDPDWADEWVIELALPVDVIGHGAVVKALRLRGVPITEASVRRHRSGHGI
jgi:hypothetical protein